MVTAISAQRLAVTFGGRGGKRGLEALAELDLEIPAGRVVGVLGPNGSGKTTLLRVLAGLQLPTSGTATVLGLPPTAKPLRRRAAYQPEGPLPIGVLSAPEFLAWVGASIGLDNRDSDERAARWLDRLDLRHAGKRWVRTFSTGMQKRLALAAVLIGDPEVLLLDEPTSGLDPFGSAEVIRILRERAAAGTTVVMASHHLSEVEEICDEVIVLHGGRLRARGSLDELLGTDACSLVVKGLDGAAMQALGDLAKSRGGEVLGVERRRSHLFALFRRLAGSTGEPHRG